MLCRLKTIERKISGNVTEAILFYMGTEFIPAEKIKELTNGKNLEIVAKGNNVKIVLNLMPKRGVGPTFVGRFHIEEKEFHDSE